MFLRRLQKGISKKNKFIAITCNATSFVIIILFFLFLLPSAVFGQTAESLIRINLLFVFKEACDEEWAHGTH